MTQWEYARLVERFAALRQGGHVSRSFTAEFMGPDGGDVLADLDRDDERTLDRLQAIGAEGWEMITAVAEEAQEDGARGVRQRTYLFKRPKG